MGRVSLFFCFRIVTGHTGCGRGVEGVGRPDGRRVRGSPRSEVGVTGGDGEVVSSVRRKNRGTGRLGGGYYDGDGVTVGVGTPTQGGEEDN